MAANDLDEAAGLIARVAGALRASVRSGDAGSLLKIGRLQARLQAARALVRSGHADAASAFAIDLLLEIGRAFPDSARREPRAEDEDLHIRYEAIGRRILAGGVPL